MSQKTFQKEKEALLKELGLEKNSKISRRERSKMLQAARKVLEHRDKMS